MGEKWLPTFVRGAGADVEPMTWRWALARRVWAAADRRGNVWVGGEGSFKVNGVVVAGVAKVRKRATVTEAGCGQLAVWDSDAPRLLLELPITAVWAPQTKPPTTGPRPAALAAGGEWVCSGCWRRFAALKDLAAHTKIPEGRYAPIAAVGGGRAGRAAGVYTPGGYRSPAPPLEAVARALRDLRARQY